MHHLTSTSSTTVYEPPTPEQIAQVADMVRRCGTVWDSLRDMMTRAGFAPKDGGVLFLPECMREQVLFPPGWIRFSPLVERPTMILMPPLGELWGRHG